MSIKFKKQVVYAGLMSRIISTMLDLCVLAALLSYPMKYISQFILIHYFQDHIILHAISLDDRDAIATLFTSTEFLNNLPVMAFLKSYSIITLVQISFASIYFVFCWYKFGATPGKFLLGHKVVKANNFEKLSVGEAIYRMLGSLTFFIGLLFVPMTSKKQALHDKIAGSVVVKR